jgi:OOP family OmpA-OmpF porin
MLALTERVNNIENKMLDTDNDGVANTYQEANTPAGT